MDSSKLSSMQIKRIEETVFRFESDWATQNQPPDYKNYFEPSDPVASTLLQELIHTDIEMRWRHGMSIDLGRYTQRHREIANDSTAVAELIWTEWELRRLGDPSITIEDILQRYPNLRRWWKELKDCNESPQKHLPLEDRLLEHEMMKPPPSLPGFKIQEVLGRGGMGIVYKAVDLQLRRDVAIKFVLSGPLASSAEFERFRMEAEIVASFRHPQVLQVYSAGEFQGQPYLVLEYAPNGNLRKRISGQPMPWRDAAEMLHGLALATEAIHQCGFLHRDLKPANVLLTSDGLAKIGDFGLAKRISADAQQTDLHAILGTPSYSAPEYLFSTIDRDKPTIDVYSLGAILYEMITGRPAFAGASFLETLEQIKEGRIINPRGLIPKIPIDLETICLKCLELSPNQRYASAKLLAEDLARFLDGRPVLARPISKATQFLRWARRNPQTAALATLSTASVLLLLIGFLAFTLYQSRNLAVQIKLREDAELASKKAITQERLALQESVAASDAMHLIEELFEVGVLDKINELVDSDQDSSVSELSARQLVETSIQTMANRLQEHPLARARVLRTLAGAAFNLGMITEARKLAEECLSICSQKIVSDTLQRASIQSLLGQIYTEQCEYGEAITLFDEAIGELQKNGMMNDTLWAELCVQRAYTATIWRDPLTVHRVQYDLKKAVSYLEERYSNDHPKNIYARIVKVMSKTRIECKYDVALRELEEIWKSVETATVHPLHKARLMNQIASVHQRLGDTFNATSCADSSLKWLKLAVPDTDHPIAATLHADAAWIAHQRGDPGEAIEYQRLALTGRWKHLGFDSSTQSLFNEFITFLRDTGRINELKHWLLRRHEASTGSLPSYLVFPYHIARVIQMEEEGNYDDALRTLDSFEKQFIDKTSEIQTAFELHRARLEFYRGNIERCRQILQDLATQHSHRLTNTPFVGPRVISPSELYAMTGQSRLIARDVNLSSETLLEDSMLDLPRFHPDNWRLYYQDCIDRASDFSLDTLESWRTGRLACEMPNHICLVSIEIAIAKGWMNAGEFERAVSVCQKVVDKLEKTHGDLPGLKLDASLELALILARGGRTHEAKNLVNEMMELCQQTTGVESIETVRRMRTASQILLVCKENQDANLVAAQATQIALKVRGLFHPEFIRWIENQAVLLYRTLGPEAAQAGVAEHLQVIQARYPTEAGGKRQLENLFSAIQSL